MITDRLAELVSAALDELTAQGTLTSDPKVPVNFERPRRREHGDWATNVALTAPRAGGKSPRAIAEAIAERLGGSSLIEKVDVAGPGFLNFHLAPAFFHEVVRRAAVDPGAFGRSELGGGDAINVEYVSANPTGPINVVSGRHAAVGDAVANLLEAVGYKVTREFYLNDAGRQMELFGRSVAAHYLQQHGVEASVPEDGYHGEYVADIAREIATEIGDRFVDAPESERDASMGELGLRRMIANNQRALERFGTRYDVWSRESDLYGSGAVADAIQELMDKGLMEERDGALWFLTTRFGDDKDRVVRRADGAHTYLAGDLAYLRDKFGRGFAHLIYLLGADHHGTVPRLLAAAQALGYERDHVEIRLLQVVTLARGGAAVKASKRAGVLVPLDELVDEVGADAARYTFLGRSIDAPLEFDIALAKEQAPENPVFYVQYAHARISSIVRKAADEGLRPQPSQADLTRLVHPSEDALMRKIAAFEEVVIDAATLRAPQRMVRYVEELASTFSAFYRDCKVIGDDRALSEARLTLCVATKGVIAAGLGLLAVSAPERM